MKKDRTEPTLADLVDDPILDILLNCGRFSREELRFVIERVRQTLIRVPVIGLI